MSVNFEANSISKNRKETLLLTRFVTLFLVERFRTTSRYKVESFDANLVSFESIDQLNQL